MTQTDERLARLETKMDTVCDELRGLRGDVVGKLQVHEVDLVKQKLQMKWLVGVMGLAALGGSGLAGVLKVFGG